MIMAMKRIKRRLSNKPEQKYFKALEASETLKPNEIFETTKKPEIRPVYTYKNGSKY